MKQIFRIIIFIIVGSFVGCYGDKLLSDYVFEQYCNEEGRTGQFIYERVSLDDEYFIPIPNDPRKVNFHFIVDDNFMMDKARLEKDYVFSKYSEVIPLSSIGPISSIETSVTRKSDNKVLGKSISLSNRQGWLAQQSILGQSYSDICPRGYNKSIGVSEGGLLHATLFENIFYRK
jgi:hypothetical protein